MISQVLLLRAPLIVAIVSFAIALPAFAQFSESGRLTLQQASAGPVVSTASSEHADAYQKFEKQLLANIGTGSRLHTLIDDFDYETARFFADSIDRKIYALVGFESEGQTREQALPAWALPIYRYAEGIPEGRLLGNVGQVDQPYAVVNDELRNPAPDSPETIAWVSEMRSAMSFLPRYEGISFRGARLTKERADQYYQVGKLAQDAAFVSTSLKAEIALRFAYPLANLTDEAKAKIALLFVVIGKTGRPISPIADDHSDEAEILFANGTQFDVVAKSSLFTIRDIEGRNQVIVLREKF